MVINICLKGTEKSSTFIGKMSINIPSFIFYTKAENICKLLYFTCMWRVRVLQEEAGREEGRAPGLSPRPLLFIIRWRDCLLPGSRAQAHVYGLSQMSHCCLSAPCACKGHAKSSYPIALFHQNERAYTGFFFKMRVHPLKITYWPHSHFLQGRQPVMLYVTNAPRTVVTEDNITIDPLWKEHL